MGTILLVQPVLMRELEGKLGFDDQTSEGLMRWTENFDKVVIASPSLPEHLARKSDSSVAITKWQALTDLPCAERIEIIPLPYAYKFQTFLQTYLQTQAILRKKIQECDYLCFAICGLIGDWGAIACQEAIKLRRGYSIWADRVEYEVIQRTIHSQPLKQRIKNYLTLPLIKPYQKYLISQSQLGLFQGQDCYSAYSSFCQQPHCVYDVHTQKSDQIDAEEIETKIHSVMNHQALKVCYVGRAAEMKGALDWLKVIHRIHESGIDIQATWLGDGPMLGQMKLFAQELGIQNRVQLPGFVGDRQQILQTMRESHIFLFCHKTPESPRCLVESLVSGCPIIGYDSPYPQGLVSQHGGGLFVPINNWQKLANLLIELNTDRMRITTLIRNSAISGKLFDEETVFQERSNLIKQYLKPKTRCV